MSHPYTRIDDVELQQRLNAVPSAAAQHAQARARARPFHRSVVQSLRASTVGPHIPTHWHDAADGWADAHFTDVVPYDYTAKAAGTHRCTHIDPATGAPCSFTVSATGDTSCCLCCKTWYVKDSAPPRMAEHLTKVHGVEPPMKRPWATPLCSCGPGTCFACFCWWCLAPRLDLATNGHRDTGSACWTIILFCTPVRETVPWCPIIIVNSMLRERVQTLQGIQGTYKEECCACCCPHLSMAQMYRELTAAGVWPGLGCCTTEPHIPMAAPSPTPVR